LSRVINPESTGKERTQYQRAIVLALRELMRQSEVDSTTYDLAAFIVIMLEAIDNSIERSVTAWEKRGYWLKADRFRQEWLWAGVLGKRMKSAVFAGDWAETVMVSALVVNKLGHVKVPSRHGLGTPWVGAWAKLSKQDSSSLSSRTLI
jgi:hypothetical protein